MENTIQVYYFQEKDGEELAYKCFSYIDAIRFAAEHKLRVIEVDYLVTSDVKVLDDFTGPKDEEFTPEEIQKLEAILERVESGGTQTLPIEQLRPLLGLPPRKKSQ